MTMLLNGCAKKNFNHNVTALTMPTFPRAGKKVGEELKVVCDKDKCKNLYNWLNDIYSFKLIYDVYKEELAK